MRTARQHECPKPSKNNNNNNELNEERKKETVSQSEMEVMCGVFVPSLCLYTLILTSMLMVSSLH